VDSAPLVYPLQPEFRLTCRTLELLCGYSTAAVYSRSLQCFDLHQPATAPIRPCNSTVRLLQLQLACRIAVAAAAVNPYINLVLQWISELIRNRNPKPMHGFQSESPKSFSFRNPNPNCVARFSEHVVNELVKVLVK
jgi:hypothetical protein